MAAVHGPVQQAGAARLLGKDRNVDSGWQHGGTECARLRSDAFRLLDRAKVAGAQRVPSVRRYGRPAVDSMFGDSGEADCRAIVEPLLPVAHVCHNFRDRMWKAVRFCVRLVRGEAVEDGARVEMDAFTPEHAD